MATDDDGGAPAEKELGLAEAMAYARELQNDDPRSIAPVHLRLELKKPVEGLLVAPSARASGLPYALAPRRVRSAGSRVSYGFTVSFS